MTSFDLGNATNDEKTVFLNEMTEVQTKLRTDFELKLSLIEQDHCFKILYAFVAGVLLSAVYITSNLDVPILNSLFFWVLASSLGIAVISFMDKKTKKKTAAIESERKRLMTLKSERELSETLTILNEYLDKEAKVSARGGAISVIAGVITILATEGWYILSEVVDVPYVIVILYACMTIISFFCLRETVKCFRSLMAALAYKKEYQNEMVKFRTVIYNTDTI